MGFIINKIAFFIERVKYRTRKFYVLSRNYYYDFKRYGKYSSTYNIRKSRSTLEGMIILRYHALEKGLSLRDPKKGFGKKKADDLIQFIQEYEKKHGINELVEISLNTLDTYYNFQLEQGLNYEEIKKTVNKMREKLRDNYTDEGGYRIKKRDHILKKSNIDFKEFVNSRHSIRDYESKKVDNKLILEAIEMAKMAPSVCNRQSAKVYVFDDEESKNKVLSYQNGNKGFGEKADKVLLVTSDLALFHGTIERNQAFIDGGMFAMTLLYALHSLGLGACSLNCSLDYNTDKKLRKAAKVNDSEAIIMMISVGWIPEQVKITHSHRKNTKEFVVLK